MLFAIAGASIRSNVSASLQEPNVLINDLKNKSAQRAVLLNGGNAVRFVSFRGEEGKKGQDSLNVM